MEDGATWMEAQFRGATRGDVRLLHLKEGARAAGPGWLTLWRGLQRLQAMAQGAQLVLPKKQFGV